MSSSRKSSVASRKLSHLMDREVMDAFNLFDRNKDGKITSEEIKELITSLGGDTHCPHVEELVRSAESQISVDVKRFMFLWKDFKAKVEDEDEDEEEIKSAFRAYDINGDGYITKDEMVQAMTKMGFVSNKEEEAGKCLKEMDLDGDGRVSYAEFMVKWRIT